jgi:hypothetical protein
LSITLRKAVITHQPKALSQLNFSNYLYIEPEKFTLVSDLRQSKLKDQQCLNNLIFGRLTLKLPPSEQNNGLGLLQVP